MDAQRSTVSQTIKIYPASKPAKGGLPTCLDLFAGAGGLAVGFRQAGWNIIGGNDLNRDAGSTFRLNFKESVFFEGPISALTTEMVLANCEIKPGGLDCLIGGPPCQSFSYNNHHRSEKDERARLFEHYLRLVRGLLPKTLVMENVPGILTIGDGQVIAEIRASLEALQYLVEVKVLSAEEFGTPQIRRRVFIVASRVGSAADMIPLPTHASASAKITTAKPKSQKQLKRFVTVQNAIGDLPSLENGGGQEIVRRSGIKSLSQFQREARKGVRRVYNHVCHALTEVNLKRLVYVPQGGNWRDVPRDLLPAGMQRAKLCDHTKRYGRLAQAGLASTILTKCDPHWGAYIHPTENRTISVREAARLQGFPDSFRFYGTNLGKQYEQVGNAVPVPVARAIAAKAMIHLADCSPYDPICITCAPANLAA
ncbi:DNA cytosine methyltransferase [Pararhizobium gei]|uniref:DNA cytosine methyltransferase n=1 Tax=Pararhizobium gei TaxID=1395951 RepID=UPI0023DC661F|nr:DNA cytosine methyltransferase [Rhizobium gei]